MKLLRVGQPGAERPAGLDADGVLRDLSDVVPDIGPAFFAGDGVRQAAAALGQGGLPPAHGRLGPPISRPGKVVCIGLNYSDHATETGQPLPPRPVIFMKDPATVVGPFDDIRIPRRSQKTDWEVELGVVLGSRARYLTAPEDGLASVAGYVISHDVSERAFHLELSSQWDLGKSCETFNPLGRADQPYLRPGDRVELEIDQLGRASQHVVAP
jgi:2-keto-4-pentenoate hydratase/2-oxohepta-3-ene-1,7-dioic acid hydratase in catechol pathway